MRCGRAAAVCLILGMVCGVSAELDCSGLSQNLVPDSVPGGSGNIPRACEQVDMVFVLDSSGSIGNNNWNKLRNFCKTVVSNFTYGDFGIRVGVVIFGNHATIQFHLNSYDTKQEVMNAIGRLPWKDQKTNTAAGLKAMTREMFVRERGDRGSVPNVGILIADGKSNEDTGSTIPLAREAKTMGITMISLGIGSEVDFNELNKIASESPKTGQRFVFNVTDFNALPAIKSNLVAAACEATAACREAADIVFALDSSGSVSARNFEKMKEFIVDTLQGLNIGQDHSHIGIIKFDDNAIIESRLGVADSRTSVCEALARTKYTYGSTNTAAALRLASTSEMFNLVEGGQPYRPYVKDILVLFTDGNSNNYESTIEAARRLREAGVTILVVAISGWLNMNEIYEVASDPDHLNVYEAENFDSLSKIHSRLRQAICNDIDECESILCQNGGTCYEGINIYMCQCTPQYAGVHCNIPCRKHSDVAVAVDSSSSIGQNNFYTVMEFIKGFIRTLPLDGMLHTRVAVQTFATNQIVRFNLKDHKTKQKIVNSLSFEWMRGTTNTAGALSRMRASMFTRDAGARDDARHVGIVITDGRSKDRDETFKQAMLTKQAGIDLLAIGIGITSPYDKRELRGIASDPDEKNVFYPANFTTLKYVTDDLVKAVCNEEDNCRGNPCNGGQCVDKYGTYECKCQNGRTGDKCEKRCDGRLDIAFMLDESGSIREDRFVLLKQFASAIASELEIRPERTRVALVTFKDDVEINFYLNDYTNKEDLLQAIDLLDYKPGRTNIADALMTIRTRVFTSAHGDRHDIPNVAILVTDGKATVYRERTLPEAIEARTAGIHMIVVSPEQKFVSLELKGISSEPHARNVHIMDKYSQLPSISSQIAASLCDDTNECSSNPCRHGGRCMDRLQHYICQCQDRYTGINCERSCTRRLDLVFTLDSSGSTEEFFDLQQQLTKLIVHGLNFRGGRTRIGIVTFSSSPVVQFHLNKYHDKYSIMNAIAFDLTGGRTHTASALVEVRQNMFTRYRGERPGDDNVVIIMTDGYSNVNEWRTIPEAQNMEADAIRVMTVGVSENINRGEINGMASAPKTENAFYLRDRTQLDSVSKQILDHLCDSVNGRLLR